MSRREDLGSWLEGTPGAPDGGGVPTRGRLALPASGSGSRAGLGRRVVGLAVDWLLSMAVSGAFFPDLDAGLPRILSGDRTATLLIFAGTTAVLLMTLGHTIGHRVAGLQVVRLRDLPDRAGPAGGDGSASVVWTPPGPVAALVRTVLLCLVIPAAIWDGDGRGMHDVGAGTVVVRR